MALTPTAYGNNPFAPGVFAETYLPDQLIAGREHLITENDTLSTQGAVLPRGTLLGKITASGNVIPCVKTAVDGSQNPYGVLVDATDATGGAVQCGVYVKGEFNALRMTIDASWGGTEALQFAGLLAPCKAAGLYLKQPLGANDPTENNAAGV